MLIFLTIQIVKYVKSTYTYFSVKIGNFGIDFFRYL